jgi:hypothetical protein
MTRTLTEVDVGEWITPRKGGRLYRVMSFDVDGTIELARYPLTEEVVTRRTLMTLYKNWRPAYSKDWTRERAAHPEVLDAHVSLEST